MKRERERKRKRKEKKGTTIHHCRETPRGPIGSVYLSPPNRTDNRREELLVVKPSPLLQQRVRIDWGWLHAVSSILKVNILLPSPAVCLLALLIRIPILWWFLLLQLYSPYNRSHGRRVLEKDVQQSPYVFTFMSPLLPPHPLPAIRAGKSEGAYHLLSAHYTVVCTPWQRPASQTQSLR